MRKQRRPYFTNRWTPSAPEPPALWGTCPSDCGLCPACVGRLPGELVGLMAITHGELPDLHTTAVRCAQLWLQAHPRTPTTGDPHD